MSELEDFAESLRLDPPDRDHSVGTARAAVRQPLQIESFDNQVCVFAAADEALPPFRGRWSRVFSFSSNARLRFKPQR